MDAQPFAGEDELDARIAREMDEAWFLMERRLVPLLIRRALLLQARGGGPVEPWPLAPSIDRAALVAAVVGHGAGIPIAVLPPAAAPPAPDVGQEPEAPPGVRGPGGDQTRARDTPRGRSVIAALRAGPPEGSVMPDILEAVARDGHGWVSTKATMSAMREQVDVLVRVGNAGMPWRWMLPPPPGTPWPHDVRIPKNVNKNRFRSGMTAPNMVLDVLSKGPATGVPLAEVRDRVLAQGISQKAFDRAHERLRKTGWTTLDRLRSSLRIAEGRRIEDLR